MSQNNIDDLLDELFDANMNSSTDIPKPDEGARAQAIAKANQTFDQAFSQTDRLKTKSTDSILRSFFMSLFSNQPLKQGIGYTAGALATVAIAVPLFLSYNSGPAPTELQTSKPPSELEMASKTVSVQDAPTDTIANTQNDATIEEEAITAYSTAKSAPTEHHQSADVDAAPIAPIAKSDSFKPMSKASSSKDNDSVIKETAKLEAAAPRPTQRPEPNTENPTTEELAVIRVPEPSIELADSDLELAEPQTQSGSAVIGGEYSADSKLKGGVLNAAVGSRSKTVEMQRQENKSAHNHATKNIIDGNPSDLPRLKGLVTGVPPQPIESVPQRLQRPDSNEKYADYQRNPITQVTEQPISTFSADVDTASYSLTRNQINRGYFPAQHAVRPEEFINYFNYDYPVANSASQPFKPTISVLDSPWNEGRKLVHIGIKGYDIEPDEIPDSNLVFLIDVSGSMNSPDKLPLAKQSISFLLKQLKPTDKVSIAVYAGAAGVVLKPTKAKNKSKIMRALNNLSAGGSTAGGAGIELAYSLANQHFDKESVNRIILLTDGDFNVGQSSNHELLELVERKRKGGVLLSVLGFGRNNYQDDMMQTLAQNGNGIATYIDSLSEAKKVMVDEATSALFPIAKDVKFQVEFNPATVSDYRLIGYETRALNTEDFNNDKVDAGDIGAGHTVTAIYEITPRDSKKPSIDKPRYAENTKSVAKILSKQGEYGYLKIRYKLPNEDKSKLIETAITNKNTKPSNDVKFSIAVAGFSQILNGDKNIGRLTLDQVEQAAKANKGKDAFGYRAEFIQLVEMAKLLE